MRRNKIARGLATLAAVALLSSGIIPPFSPAINLAKAAGVHGLGDLSQFRTIAKDIATLIDKRDFAGANARMKELEAVWDEAAEKLKPQAAADWYVVDHAIDKVLVALRSGAADPALCKREASELVDTLN